MAALEPVTFYEVLRKHGVSKSDAAKMAHIMTDKTRMDLRYWCRAPWGELINLRDGTVEYPMDMDGFPPGTVVYMTDATDTSAFMFEVWVPSPFGEEIKIVHAGLERNVAAEMPERGEAMRNKVREQLEVMAWEAYAEVGGICE